MLILNRKIEQGIQIGDRIEIKILGITAGDKTGSRKSRVASIGIDAPREISILRRELVETRRENVAAALNPVDAKSLAGVAGLLKTKRSLLNK
ncbi:MAG: carbon storage regulator [Oscillospiraceae bacterium]|nr:carbon storage regulator [Oscillospiraceae bacterium]